MMSRYTHFTKLKHLIFPNGGSRYEETKRVKGRKCSEKEETEREEIHCAASRFHFPLANLPPNNFISILPLASSLPFPSRSPVSPATAGLHLPATAMQPRRQQQSILSFLHPRRTPPGDPLGAGAGAGAGATPESPPRPPAASSVDGIMERLVRPPAQGRYVRTRPSS
jgi:hypothetical protein